jgi:hypothetical protein
MIPMPVPSPCACTELHGSHSDWTGDACLEELKTYKGMDGGPRVGAGWMLTDAEPLESYLDASSRGEAGIGVGLLVFPAHRSIYLWAERCCS